jgi:hypothetical protein
MKTLLFTAAFLALTGAAFGRELGTEAKTMLEKAAAAVKADRESALAQFNRGNSIGPASQTTKTYIHSA